MESGDRLATEPASEGSRQSDHMDRTPPYRGRGDGHRQRGRHNKGLVSPKMTEAILYKVPLSPFARRTAALDLIPLNRVRDHISDRGSRMYVRRELYI